MSIDTNTILESNELKNKIKCKISNLKNRLDQSLDNVNFDTNIEIINMIYEKMDDIEENIIKLENNISDFTDISLDEKKRIIDQKVLKFFTPFILYYRLSLLENID
jgi:hypothetical protein